MYKYLLYKLWMEGNWPNAEQIHSSNDYYSVLSWMMAASQKSVNQGSDEEFVIIIQSGVDGFRQCLH